MDAKKLSLWWDVEAQQEYPGLAGRASADVTVIGAGITGLTTALLLQEEGLRVTVVEADRVASGVTGSATAKVTALHELVYADLRRLYDEETARLYASLNQRAIDLVATLAGKHSIDCSLERAPAYTYTLDADRVEKIRDEVDAATAAGLAASFETEIDLPFAVRAAIRVEDQIIFDPRAYCAGLARAFVAAGGSLYEHTRATEVEPGSPCQVITRGGTIESSWVVFATQIPFTHRGIFFTRAYPMRSYLLAVRLTTGAARPRGMYISCDPRGHTLRPAGDDLFLVGGEGHKTGQDEDTEDNYRRLATWAKAHFPVTEVTHRWSGQDWVSVDRLPFVGAATPGQERLLVATGFSKWGLSLGSAAAEVLRDAVLDRPTPERELLSPSRLNVPQAAKDFVRENADVVKHFVADKLAAAKAEPIDSLRPGEGRIADWQGDAVAAYRDENGQLYALAPACTHLGCTVAWNNAEKSWDCPCHGSRFDVEGRVIQGPAVEDLERKL